MPNPSRKKDATAESLRRQIESEADPAEKLKLKLKLADHLWLSDPTAARPLYEQVLAEGPTIGRIKSATRAASILSYICRGTGEYEASRRYARQVFELGRVSGDKSVPATALDLLGGLHLERGEYGAAQRCFEKCLEVSEAVGFESGRMSALNQLASLHGEQGRLDQALGYYRRYLEDSERSDDHHGSAIALHNVAWTLALMGRFEEAAQDFYRVIARSEQHGFRDILRGALVNLGEIHLKRNRRDEAAALFNEVISIARSEASENSDLAYATMDLGDVRFQSGDLAAAEACYAEAEKLARAAGLRRILAQVALHHAELALARGEADCCGELLSRGRSAAAELGLKAELAQSLCLAARLKAALGETAGDDFSSAAAASDALGDAHGAATARLHHGCHLAECGQWEEAAPLLRTAASQFRRLGVVEQAETANRLLFKMDARRDREQAMLERLAAAQLEREPRSALERLLSVICGGLDYDSGVLLVGRTPVAAQGQVRPEVMLQALSRTAIHQNGDGMSMPLKSGERLLGTLVLVRGAAKGPALSLRLVGALEQALLPVLSHYIELSERAVSPSGLPAGLNYRGFVGTNPVVIENLRIVAQVADMPVPVLIRGESGTGKELIARALHDSGTRRGRPFVAVNCAAVPESLLEAEFFGVERGAATGIVARMGRLEAAREGTVFLDEIGDMSPGLQAKLLRVLQEKTVERVGGTTPVPVDVRVVAATNMDLDDLMRRGRFRPDLFYRLNAIDILMPPLRERRDDIPGLVEYFIESSNRELRGGVRKASDHVLAIFRSYEWPGNIRQLQHVIERAVALARDAVLISSDLPPEVRAASSAAAEAAEPRHSVSKAADEAERRMVSDCLDRANGNITHAARLSGYSRVQFHRLMRKHGITAKPDSR